jgi:hypothetical protein
MGGRVGHTVSTEFVMMAVAKLGVPQEDARVTTKC